MFFIGGFNTIFPHLIYLSLIWAFLLISLSGKINLSGTERIFHSEQQSLIKSTAEEQSDLISIYIALDADTDKVKKAFSGAVIYITFHDPVDPFLGWPVSIDLRGPPLT